MTTNNAEILKTPFNVKYQERSISFPVPEKVKTPWFKAAGEIPTTLKYFDGSMADALEATAKCLPDTMPILWNRSTPPPRLCGPKASSPGTG